MTLLFGLLALFPLFVARPTRTCPESEKVCVVMDDRKIIGINTTESPVIVKLDISQVENIKFTYKNPHIMQLAPNDETRLLEYQVKNTGLPHALEYTWRSLTPVD